MNITHARHATFFVAFGSMTLLQGCFPLGLLGVAGAYGIVKTTETVGQVGDATTDLINNTSNQISLTAEQIRTTLASIDTLVQHLTKDADALTNQTTSSLAQLTQALTTQIAGLTELRKTIQDTITQGGKDVGDTLASVDQLLASANASLQAVTALLSLTSAVAGGHAASTARVIQPDHAEVVAAGNAYLATRGLAPGAPASDTNAGATPMPNFTDTSSPDRS